MIAPHSLSFIKSKGPGHAATTLSEILTKQLKKDNKVLWLISGGTSIPIAVEVMSLLPSDITSLLTITLVDEIINQGQSTNHNKLEGSGFNFKKATYYPIVKSKHTNEDAAEFNKLLFRLFEENDFRVGQFGLGDSGHTGGIIPNSPAATEQELMAISYEHMKQTKITITPLVIRKLDCAFINSYGETKRQLVEMFKQSGNGVLQPIQYLKESKSTILSSDVLG